MKSTTDCKSMLRIEVFSHTPAAVIAVLLTALLAASCTGSGCLEGRSGVPKVEFRSSASGETIRVDSLRISGVGAPADSAVVTPYQSVSEASLPLPADSHIARWCISYRQAQLDRPELNDTLTFDYDATPYFVSYDCGVGYRYYINSLSCTRHLIDSVQLLDPLVTNTDKVYVAIYFRTAQ